MNQPVTPARNLIAETETLVAWFIGQIDNMISPESLRTRMVTNFISRNYLRPAESALRRLIHLIAANLKPEPARAPASRPENPREGGDPKPRTQLKPRTPLFRLTEPLPRIADPRGAKPDPNRGPRIRNFDDPVMPAPARAAADPSACERNILRRLEALRAAFADPVRAARQLQRLARRLAPERPVLSTWKIPGFDSLFLWAEGQQTLTDLNTTVLRIRTAYHNSS